MARAFNISIVGAKSKLVWMIAAPNKNDIASMPRRVVIMGSAHLLSILTMMNVAKENKSIAVHRPKIMVMK